MTGTLTLLRFHLRRDRLMLTWRVLGGVLLYYSQAVSTDSLYATQAELDRAARGMESNVAFIAMAGPARALDTVGGQVAWQAAAFGAVVAGLMSMFLVVRHTRAEEESGRDELVRAAVVGRYAPVAAAALVVVVANVLLGSLVAASLLSYGLPGAGSWALGLAAALAGLVFGAVALVAVQVAEGSRAAVGMTCAAIAVAYLLRAVGDTGDGALSWLSPIGWGQSMRPYADESWWPALLSVAAVVVLAAVAVWLLDRRDLGSGLWATRPEPGRGRLGSSWGLAWRLQRGSVVGWLVGLLLGGLAFGSIGDDVGDLVGDSNFSQDVFAQGGGSIVDSFYATLAVMLGLLAAGFTISSVLRLRGEESDHFAELLLSTGLCRRRWAVSHLAVAVVGTVAVVAAGALGLGLGFALVTGDVGTAATFAAAASAYVVPALVLGGVTTLAWSLRSAWARAGWVLLVFGLVVLLFGATLQLPAWLMDLSPFNALALVPAESFSPGPWIGQAVLVAVLGIAGIAALERRDID